MTFGEAIKTCFNKYSDFTGRARRKEFWYFVLFNYLIIIGFLVWCYSAINLGFDGIVPLILYFLYCLAVIIPNLAVSWRRLHDTDHSGGVYFLSLIPFVGSIIVLVFLCTDSDIGENEYGPNPKGIISVNNDLSYQQEPTYSTTVTAPPVQRIVEEPVMPQADNPAVFCHKCGTKLVEGSDFCHKCGTRRFKGE